MRASRVILLAALGACSPAPLPVEPTPAPSPPPVVSSSPPVGAPSASAKAPLPPPKPVEARFLSFSIMGLEARVAALRIRTTEPQLRACVDRAPEERGSLTVTMGVDGRGKVVNPKAEGPLRAALGACVMEALQGITFDGPVPKDAKVSVVAIVREERDERALPELGSHEMLIVEDDASCVGLAIHPCAPHKACMAPTRRPVRCPDVDGLPERVRIADADRFLVLKVSGGKTGQGGEQVIVVEGSNQCILVRRTHEVTDGLPEVPGDVEVQVDVPCSKAKVVWAAVGKHKLTTFRSPKGTPTQIHAVSRFWRLTTRGRANVPVVVEGSWSGEDKGADAAFNAVGSEAAKLAKEMGITLGRFE